MLQLEAIGKTVQGRHLFRGVTWSIHPGDRIGLIGPNGSGKSSLLKLIAARDEPDEGRLHRRHGVRISYLPQEVEAVAAGSESVLSLTLAGAEEIQRLGAELAILESEIHRAAGDRSVEPSHLARISESYGEKRALFEWFGGHAIEARARAVLSGLGFSASELDEPISTFSGGWRMRALLGRMLLSGADLLLLDEPTNHLDLEALDWLESQLVSTPAALIVVSHDRLFLDRVVRKIADLQGEKLRITPGNYSAWVERRDLERVTDEARLKNLTARASELQQFVDRFRYKATKAAQAQDRLRELEKVESERAAIQLEQSRSWRFRWPEAPASSDELFSCEGVSLGYGEKRVLSEVGLRIRSGQRIAVLGANGSGKSTLLKMIAGELLPLSGRRQFGAGLVVAKFAQHQLEELDPDATVLAAALKMAPTKNLEQVRRALGALGIGDFQIERRIRTLSGGEKARLSLARLLLNPANLLLLDEPTNHLDLPMREGLEAALAGWSGAVLVVSHDRAFLKRLTNQTLNVEDGKVQYHPFGWEGWESLQQERRRQRSESSAAGASPARSKQARRERAEERQQRSRRLKPLSDRLQRLELEVHQCEERLRAIDDALADPKVHSDGEQMRTLVRERAEIGERLPPLFSEWEAAAEELAAVEAELESE